MIISGGSNIYPREMKEVMLRHLDLAEVSVVGRPHPEWSELVAFVVVRPVVVRPGAEIRTEALGLLCLDRFKRPRDYPFHRCSAQTQLRQALETELRRLLARSSSQVSGRR
jgi:acyl-CoA synthetase (AMP-forming)/AMP-acid ligase II